jgi:hypothetical protein
MLQLCTLQVVILPQIWLIRTSPFAFLPLLCCIITIATTEYVWVSSSSSVSHSVGIRFFLLFFFNFQLGFWKRSNSSS